MKLSLNEAKSVTQVSTSTAAAAMETTLMFLIP